MDVLTTISIILIRCLIWASGMVSCPQRPTSDGKLTIALSSMILFHPSAKLSLTNSTRQWQILIHMMRLVLVTQIHNLSLFSETLKQRIPSLLETIPPSWRRVLAKFLPASMPSLFYLTLTMLQLEPNSIFQWASKLGISARATSTIHLIPLDQFKFTETWRTSTESSSTQEIQTWLSALTALRPGFRMKTGKFRTPGTNTLWTVKSAGMLRPVKTVSSHSQLSMVLATWPLSGDPHTLIILSSIGLKDSLFERYITNCVIFKLNV